jgi:hypothetical protein
MSSAPEEYSRSPAAMELSSSKDPRDWGRAISRAVEALAERLSGETGAAAGAGLLGQDDPPSDTSRDWGGGNSKISDA